ncbi:nicastrin [Andrographis paniculata]|uniref:nicastrin n=1 Tax=Andrographis paniculata TaxID=175694 RepID=UPI0021E862F4|nr:nicastrin [Andrographis paniculata]
MGSKRKLLLQLTVLFFLDSFRLSFSVSEGTNSFESVPDLEKSMYTQVEGFPCVRLLNLSGEIGCSNHGRGKVVAQIVKFDSIKELVGSAAILVSVGDFESLLSRITEDSGFAAKVAGILVESGSEVQNAVKGFSPDVKFPQAEFAPYNSNNFEWNPSGSGSMWKAYNIPIFLLSQNSTSILREVASKKVESTRSYTKNVAEFDLVMQTTKSGTHDSHSCLKERTCLPLGGYSVWSALPPINNLTSPKEKPILLAMTSMDSASFFRDKSLGAQSPISGLIALLAVADALSHLKDLDKLNKQLVFVVLTGEAWGYLGSQRFLLESDQQSDTIKGINLSKIETVVEIGSVGKSSVHGTRTFFTHTTEKSSADVTFEALQSAQDSLKTDNIVLKPASRSNPGVPPSSLMTFMRKRPQISGVVLEDFDSTFSNNFYHSHLDEQSNVNSSSIVAAASLVARALYILAGGNDPSVMKSIKINSTLVEELLGCLLNCEPGLSCGLVKHYISPSTTCPSHYVGVLLGEPSSALYPPYAGDISRFVWNFLADKTSIPSKNASSSCPKDCSSVGELCVGAELDGKGVCVISTTRYVPAYSTRLKYESGGWTVLPIGNASNVEDPVWTESNWDAINVRIYTIQSTTYDHLILALGIGVTVISYILIEAGRTMIRKALKQD